MATNTSVQVTKLGGLDGISIITTDIPTPKAGEVRIRVLTAGVSQADITILHGMYPISFKPPFTLGYDLVGVVDAFGTGVSGYAIGEKVAAITIVGAYTQYICWKADDLIKIPAEADNTKAVCMLLNYVTAYQMLHRTAKVQRGERVLIHSAAGGVGTALVQLGKLMDLEMYGTCSTGKMETVRLLGATPIDYTREDSRKRIMQLTGDGVDVAFDAIGGKSFTESYKSLRKGGRFIAYGFTSQMKTGRSGTFLRLAPMFLIPDGKKASFYGIMFLKKSHPEWFQEDIKALIDLLMTRKINPLVAAVLPLSEAQKALEMLDNRQVVGKVVLECSTDVQS